MMERVKNIYLLDKQNIHNNNRQVINQYSTEDGQRSNRYDVTILVNGLPLIHVVLKRRGVAIQEAFNQINRYQRESFWADSGLFECVLMPSKEFVRGSAKNKLNEGHIKKIVDCYAKLQVVEHFSYLAKHQEIADNDYSLSVSSYVEPKDTKKVIDIAKLNLEIAAIFTRQSQLITEIDSIVIDLEGK